MIKKIVITASILAILIFTVACDKNSETGATNSITGNDDSLLSLDSDVKINVGSLKGPTGMGLSKLMEDYKDSNINFTLVNSPDEIVGKVISGELDFACVPINMASVLYNKTEKEIQLVGVNTEGVLYLIDSSDMGVESLDSLNGQMLYVSGKGAMPEYITNYLLEQNNIDTLADITIEYVNTHDELVNKVVSGEAQFAILPEPFVTVAMTKGDVKSTIDLTKEWEKVSVNNTLYMGAIIAKKDFLENNKEATKEFLNLYEESVNWVNNNPKEASILIEKHGILASAALAEKAIPRSNMVFLNAYDEKDKINKLYDILKEYNPKSIGGSVPDDEFYYIEENNNQ